jgi:hypothetical protein
MSKKSKKLSLRFQVLKRDNHTCIYCGGKPPNVVLEVDHINPRSKGGATNLSNLVTSCFNCNRGKRDTLLTDLSEQSQVSYDQYYDTYKPTWLPKRDWFDDAIKQVEALDESDLAKMLSSTSKKELIACLQYLKLGESDSDADLRKFIRTLPPLTLESHLHRLRNLMRYDGKIK